MGHVAPVAPAAAKPFAWSYSKLKNFTACPKRHWHVDLARDVKEPESDDLKWGNAVHKAFDERLGKRKPMPHGMGGYELWAAKVEGMGGQLLAEQKLAFNRDFEAVPYFSPDVWYRGKADATVLRGPVAWTGDWKTGKFVEDSPQLALTAAGIFAAYPAVQAVRSEFVWLREGTTTPMTWYRNGMSEFWTSMLPRVAMLERAHATTDYPAKPGHLCRNWCPVKSCPHNGR